MQHRLDLHGRLHAANGRYKKLIALATCLCFFGLVFSLFIASDGTSTFLMTVAVFSMVVVLSPILFSRRYFLFEPISFVAISVLMGLCLKSFYVVLGFDSSAVVRDKLMFNLTMDEMVWSTSVLFIGLVLFSLGYFVGDRPLRIKRYRGADVNEQRSILIGGLFILISLVAFAVFIKSSGFSYTSFSDLSKKRFLTDNLDGGGRLSNINYYYYRLSLFSKAPMYFLFYLMLVRGYSLRSLVGLLFAISLVMNMAVPFFVSNKAGVILPLADLTVMSFIVRGQLNWKKLLSLSILVIILVGVIASLRAGDAASGHSIFDRVFGGRYFIGITKSAHIINAFSFQFDFIYGQSLISWLNPILPESLRVDSIYFTGLGYYLGSYVFGYQSSGVPPGIVAEYYMNFGVWGVVVGMFITGLVFKKLHLFLFERLDSTLFLVLYAIITVRLPTFMFNNGLSVALLKVVADVILVVIFFFFVRKYSSRSMV